MKKLTIMISESDHKKIKMAAAESGIFMKDFIMRCIRKAMKINEPIRQEQKRD